jgi:hypothetical protein
VFKWEFFKDRVFLFFLGTTLFLLIREISVSNSITSSVIEQFARVRYLLLFIASLFVYCVLRKVDLGFLKIPQKYLVFLMLLNLVFYLSGFNYFNAPIASDNRVFLWPITTILFVYISKLLSRDYFTLFLTFVILALTLSRAIIVVLFLVPMILYNIKIFKNIYLVSFYAIILIYFSTSLFVRFKDENLSEDNRNIEVANYFIKVKNNPEILLLGAPFHTQIWEGSSENDNIFDSELAWAVYSKYEIHNFFLMLVFRLGIPLSILWLVIIFRTYSGGAYLFTFIILGVTSNAFATNPEALSSIFLAKLFKKSIN